MRDRLEAARDYLQAIANLMMATLRVYGTELAALEAIGFGTKAFFRQTHPCCCHLRQFDR